MSNYLLKLSEALASCFKSAGKFWYSRKSLGYNYIIKVVKIVNFSSSLISQTLETFFSDWI